jgi:peptide/nickel transport system ATP-binding protein
MVDASLRATILASLRTMNRDLGISIVYITHDLATAFQISDTIVVLYRGSVVEIGDVELVVKRPQHPYTQLLLSSIPMAGPERTWMTEKQSGAVATNETIDRGCKFAGRCPSVAASCREAAPSLFQTDRDRAVACYLYRDAPTVTGDHHQPRRSK